MTATTREQQEADRSQRVVAVKEEFRRLGVPAKMEGGDVEGLWVWRYNLEKNRQVVLYVEDNFMGPGLKADVISRRWQQAPEWVPFNLKRRPVTDLDIRHLRTRL
jgi:hypothetical protein